MRAVLLVLLCGVAGWAQPEAGFYISTAAGNGTRGFSVDGVTATSASLLLGPGGLAADAQGNLYIADGGGRIRKVSPAGLLTTLGPAAAVGLAVDAAGNLFAADAGICRVQKVTSQGVDSIVAGKGCGFGGDGGPATAAQLLAPRGVAVDGLGNLYIADSGNQRVRLVSPDGKIQTVAGSGARGFAGDGGPAAAARFDTPWGVAVDGAGNLYIADLGNYRIRRVTAGGLISTFAGTGTAGFGGDGGPATAARLTDIRGLAADAAGNLYLADTANQRVRAVTPDGVIRTVAGTGVQGFSGDGGLALAAQLRDPYDVAVDGSGAVFVLDANNHRIRKLTPSSALAPCAAVRLDPASLEVASSGAAGAIRVTVQPAGCTWTTASNAAWLTVAPAGAAGDGTLSYVVAVNPGVEARRGAITVGSAVFSVVQQGICTYGVDPAGASHPESAGEGSFAVKTPYAACAWTAASGAPWLVITSPARGTGSAAIRYQVAPQTGAEARRTTVFVGSGAQGATFTVTQAGAAPRSVTVAGVVNAAGFTPGMSPGSWVSIFGQNLAPIAAPGRAWRSEEIVDGRFPVTLEGVSVRIDGRPAFLYFVGPAQLNVQAPDTETLGPVAVEVTTPAGSSRMTAEMRPLAPALFVIGEAQGRRHAAAVHPSGLLVGRPEVIAGSRPARPGEILMLFGTGFGPTTPARPAGRIVDPAPLNNPVTVRIGGLAALTLYAGLAGAGLNQINVVVPDLPAGDHSVVVETGGVQTQPGVFLAVER